MSRRLPITQSATFGGRVDSMQIPWILRSKHNSLMGIMKANLDSRESAIQALRQLLAQKDQTLAQKDQALAQKDQEILALVALAAQPKCNDYTKGKAKKEEKPQSADVIPWGRSGWRARAQMLSEATVPKPNDSARALEEKVIKEGGTV